MEMGFLKTKSGKQVFGNNIVLKNQTCCKEGFEIQAY
jgi:hypothetical protein